MPAIVVHADVLVGAPTPDSVMSAGIEYGGRSEPVLRVSMFVASGTRHSESSRPLMWSVCRSVINDASRFLNWVNSSPSFRSISASVYGRSDSANRQGT